jgi:uncharacterized repeat protein (TIGR01451 family)
VLIATLAASVVAVSAFAVGEPADASDPYSIIDNGTVQLGVHEEGHLNVPGGSVSLGSGEANPGTTDVGLRYIPTGAEGTAPGCLCEGWGAADADSLVTGYANEAINGVVNILPVSLTATDSTVISVVEITDGEIGVLRVTHDYHPTEATPNLYEVTVTIENISGAPVDPLYRRVMDWDVEPTAFSEFVTIETGNATNLLFSSDDGFATANPLGGPSSILFTGEALDSGPTDHGALFDFAFATLEPEESVSFNIYYGAAGTEVEALAALAAVGAEVYSLGQTNTDPTLGTPNTFIFAFEGVGGDPIATVDLAVTKSGPETASSGENVAYTIDVTNNESVEGGGTATDVTITDTPPDGASLVTEGSHECWVPGEGNLICSVGNLGPGETAFRPLVLALPTVEEETVVTNTASVAGGQTDPDALNNTDSADTTVTPSPVDGVFLEPGETLVSDDGMTGPDNQVSAQIIVPDNGTAGVYTLAEIDEVLRISKGAAEYTGPDPSEPFLIQVNCDETKCPKRRVLDLLVFVIKENPDGSEELLPPCHLVLRIRGRTIVIDRPAPCVQSVARNPLNAQVNPGDLVWTVSVLGGDPIIKAR